LYPPGAAYARHFDRLVGSDVRAISAALYLNEQWTEADGAHLRIYTGAARAKTCCPSVAAGGLRFREVRTRGAAGSARAHQLHRLVQAAPVGRFRMSDPTITLIVAVADNGVIGRDNTLPWHLPDDLKRFKRLTMGKPIVMGTQDIRFHRQAAARPAEHRRDPRH
jgi:hypothetical protein